MRVPTPSTPPTSSHPYKFGVKNEFGRLVPAGWVNGFASVWAGLFKGLCGSHDINTGRASATQP